MPRSAFLYSAEILAGAAILLVLLRVRVHRYLLWGVVGYGILAYGIVIILDLRDRTPDSTDLMYFWSAGRTIWQGGDPYSDPYLLNPPTATPLYVLFGLASLPTIAVIWASLNAIGGLLLVPLAYRTLSAVDAPDDWKLPPVVVGLLTVIVGLSFSFRLGVQTGQLSCLVALALLAAILVRAKGQRVLAGVLLAAATIKTGMMLPFLLLFPRRSDWRVWAAMALTALVLCLTATPAPKLLERCQECLKHISAFSQRGMENDYSYDNVTSKGEKRYIEIFGFDHLLYRAGLRDRAVIQAAQYALLLLLGAWIAWQVIRRPDLPRGAACSLVAIYSAVFLYHRLQDMIILALPLTYVIGRALIERGRACLAYLLCAAAILGVLHLRTGMLLSLTERYANSTSLGGRLIEALVLPYGTWLVLLALGCLTAAESFRCRDRPAFSRPAVE
jgi:Glycosyltransferase family 87